MIRMLLLLLLLKNMNSSFQCTGTIVTAYIREEHSKERKHSKTNLHRGENMFSQTLKHLKTQTYVTSCDASKPKELLFGFFNWINYKMYHDHGNTFCQRENKKVGACMSTLASSQW